MSIARQSNKPDHGVWSGSGYVWVLDLMTSYTQDPISSAFADTKKAAAAGQQMVTEKLYQNTLSSAAVQIPVKCATFAQSVVIFDFWSKPVKAKQNSQWQVFLPFI